MRVRLVGLNSSATVGVRAGDVLRSCALGGPQAIVLQAGQVARAPLQGEACKEK